ncbi:MAG: NAD(P)/FAD-dependent oxidoreductase, partial [Pseudomonadota bacterium]|nr:NAD(P)/FAD-dependent oxidoreductase [Pseudomonadota bacterium]
MSEREYDVIIVGAGFAGMYLLHRVRKLGMRARVLEAGSDVGGTWYWNRYPGARCDVESMQYSYQFDDDLQQEWSWSERYSPQPEILKYAQHVSERYDLRRDIDFNTRVTSAAYDEDSACWTLTSEEGEKTVGHYFVMATGCLSAPNWPKIDGLDSFVGPTYHTALWPHEKVDFTGQRVGVIGTGSSAIQSIPHIAREAKHLTVFQRTANYAIPAHNAPLDPERERKFKAHYSEMRARAKTTPGGLDVVYNQGSVHDASSKEQFAAFEHNWQRGGLGFMSAFGDLMMEQSANDIAANFVRDKIRATVNDPATAETLCPKNIIGAKRLCVEIDYFQTYNRENVELIDVSEKPIEAITPSGIRAHGIEHQIDALVIATGFDAMTGALTRVDIRGRGTTPLAERWKDGPSSYLGLAMHDFPNLFTVTGPGSPSVFSNMLPTIEQHVDWIADCLGHAQKNGYKTIEADA